MAEEYELQKLLADTLDQVERNYVKDISRRELMEAAIHGVLNKLDQYSNYISPDDLASSRPASKPVRRHRHPDRRDPRRADRRHQPAGRQPGLSGWHPGRGPVLSKSMGKATDEIRTSMRP